MTKPQGIAIGVTFALAGAGVVGLYRLAIRYWDFGAAAADLPAAVASYRGDGLPFVAADLFPRRPKPEENAAPAIRAAIAAMPRKVAETRLAAELKRTDAGADAAVTPYVRALALVQAAVDRPRVDFRRDWDLGPFLLFPEYAGMKTLAKAVVLRATQEATKGDDAAALRDLTLARRLALWAGGEPTLIGMLVRLSAEGIALDGAERCIGLAAKRPERIARYAAWLERAPPLPRFGEALRGEMFMGVATARNLDVMGGVDAFGRLPSGEDDKPVRLDPARLRRSGVPDDANLRGFLARHLRYWDDAYRATNRFEEPPEAIARHLEAIDARLEDQKGFSYILLRILAPVFSQAGVAVTSLEARRAVEAGFAEALTSHVLTGRWPTRVAGVDPFTGGLLRVRVGKDFRVWSVGRDRHDDGGLLRREASKRPGSTHDEVAVYPPPR